MSTSEEINEPVDVLTIFERGAVRPVKFRWSGRTHAIERVAYRWTTRAGAEPVRHFAVVAAGGALYELTLHTHTLRWTLRTVQVEG